MRACAQKGKHDLPIRPPADLCAVLSRYQVDFADELDRSRVTLEEALNLSYDGSFQMAWPAPLRLTPRKSNDA